MTAGVEIFSCWMAALEGVGGEDAPSTTKGSFSVIRALKAKPALLPCVSTRLFFFVLSHLVVYYLSCTCFLVLFAVLFFIFRVCYCVVQGAEQVGAAAPGFWRMSLGINTPRARQ